MTERHTTNGSDAERGADGSAGDAAPGSDQRLPADHAVSRLDNTVSDLDQTSSDADQTASDADQTASDSDQTASDRDRSQAAADQRTSNRDQAAADRDRADRLARGEQNGGYEQSRAERLEGTLERAETGRARAQTARDRLEHGEWRDQNARLRDLSAEARDRAAEQRDRLAARLDRSSAARPAESARARAADVRARAAAERARGAEDRAAASADRAAAERDREQAKEELRQAQFDELTGAYGRALGMVTLEREINRARHGGGRLVLVLVDVDRLKQVNDSQGHAAGDELLRDVVAAMRTHLRSYDPIVRIGGDEFICALMDCTPEDAVHRFREIQTTIERTQPTASFSFGLGTLRREDTLQQLIERGDAALYEAKRSRADSWAPPDA